MSRRRRQTLALPTPLRAPRAPAAEAACSRAAPGVPAARLACSSVAPLNTLRRSDSRLSHARGSAAPQGAEWESASTRADALLATASVSAADTAAPGPVQPPPGGWRVDVRQFFALLKTRWLLKVSCGARLACERVG